MKLIAAKEKNILLVICMDTDWTVSFLHVNNFKADWFFVSVRFCAKTEKILMQHVKMERNSTMQNAVSKWIVYYKYFTH